MFFVVELETKRILLEIFKEKQQKSTEAGKIPSFYKKASFVFFTILGQETNSSLLWRTIVVD